MSKLDKLIVLILGATLAWYIFVKMPKEAQANADRLKAASTNETVEVVSAAPAVQEAAPAAKPVESEAAPAAKKVLPEVPERLVTLENDEVKLELSTWGAVVKKVTLKKYARDLGEISEKNPAVVLDYTDAPMGAGDEIHAFEVAEQTADSVRFTNGTASRVIRLGKDYRIEFSDVGLGGDVGLGTMKMGDSKNDLLSVDSWALDAGKGKEGVIHHGDDDSPLKENLVGGAAGGCSGSKSAAGEPESVTKAFPGAQKWIAIKNRFFVTALASATVPSAGFEATIARDLNAAAYRPREVEVKAKFGAAEKRDFVFYAGPKKQALLSELGMRDVMEFGMWRVICYPIVWVLNFFYEYIPNYGVAILLLTLLIRVIFWPLTRKSTIGMKKMQEIQPLMKEIQAKYKDNPQRLQQETWALYKEKQVNPMSSCLPMLIQIPVFIALFNVLRSAVELRYAPFLWIGDLSEPEGLFAAYLPFGGLNLLPILMAVTTGLQSAFSPSAGGDNSQRKMMTVFMPIMMLVMFYSFPSALSLYWFVSNVLSIVQMWMIRRQTAVKSDAAVMPEVIDPPTTRQMRRHT